LRKKKATFVLDEDLLRSLKYRSADTGLTLSDLVERALRKYLED